MKVFPFVCSYSRPGGKEKGDIQKQDKKTFLAGQHGAPDLYVRLTEQMMEPGKLFRCCCTQRDILYLRHLWYLHRILVHYIELEKAFKVHKNQVFYGVRHFWGKVRIFKLLIAIITTPVLNFITIFVTSEVLGIFIGIWDKLSVKGLIKIMMTGTHWRYFKWKESESTTLRN